jgi:hypothetical protein
VGILLVADVVAGNEDAVVYQMLEPATIPTGEADGNSAVSRATCRALRTLGELPLGEMPMTTSPGSRKLISCSAKMFS